MLRLLLAAVEILPLIMKMLEIFVSLQPSEKERFKDEAHKAMEEAKSTGNTHLIGEFLRNSSAKKD